MSYSIAKTRIHRGARMKTRLEKCQGIDGAVCGAIERSMLTPYPDFGKATHSPCGHSKRARHRGNDLTATTLSLGSISTQPELRHLCRAYVWAKWKQTGPSGRVR